jgi:SAM-dependent methyltransferase
MRGQDRINRGTWSTASARRGLGRRTGFLPGEQVPFERVRDRLARRPVLELGVGVGRTIGFTSPLTDDYRAIDYVPEMVATCRGMFPDLDIALGDARDLEGFPSGHFGLVTFAWNGIDAVSHTDRLRVLQEVRRVLRPDGMFFFSTLNLDGPDILDRPWQVPIEPHTNPVIRGLRAMRAAPRVAQQLVNWVRVQPLRERGPGYAVAPLGAHGFGIVAHYTTLARQLEELASAGFARDPEVYASVTGKPVRVGDDTHEIGHFHLIATPTGS